MKFMIVVLSLWLGVLYPVFGQMGAEWEKEKPLWILEKEGVRLNIYGYKGSLLSNGVVRGAIQPDSSVFLSGFAVMDDQEKILLEKTEYSVYQLKKFQDSLYIDLIMHLPVGENMTWEYVPVIRYVVSFKEGHWSKSKGRDILDMSKLRDQDFVKMKKDLGWGNLKPEIIFPRTQFYPELRLTHAFLICLKYFPEYNKEYYKLDRGDGAVAEIFKDYAGILKELGQK